jgi:hypothetical protein
LARDIISLLAASYVTRIVASTVVAFVTMFLTVLALG